MRMDDVRKEDTIAELGLMNGCDRVNKSDSEMYTGRFAAVIRCKRG